jgi:hypothetical protein
MKDELEKELYALQALYAQINTKVFDEQVVSPLKDKLVTLGFAYNCKTLEELATLKGKAEAYNEVLRLVELEPMSEKIVYLRNEIEKLDKGI